MTAPERAELIVHAGVSDTLLPIHPTSAGEGVTVAFNVSRVTCEVCLTLLDEVGRQLFGPAKDRHYRALEAGLDAIADPSQIRAEHARAVEAAIAAAVRVQMQGAVYEAGYRAYDESGGVHSRALGEALKAAFEAAGFEVEQ